MGSRGRCSPDFAAALAKHSGNGGLWAINTGRTLDHAIEGLEIFDAPVDPDFLLTTEREIYRRDASGGWLPHGEWNSVSRHRHAELFKGASRCLPWLNSSPRKRITLQFSMKISFPPAWVPIQNTNWRWEPARSRM